MKKYISILFLFIPVLISGCIPFSLYPIYSDDTLIFEPALVGWWAKPDAKEIYVFSANGEKGYNLTFLSMEEGALYFDAYLADIDGTVFIDLYPENTAFETDKYSGHSIRLHSFYVVEQFEPTLKILPIDMGWLGQYLKDNPGVIDYEIFGNTGTLTAPTEQIQAFLRKIIESDVTYYKAQEFERIK